MNITDIGHLSSDADSGEDKMTKGLLREGKELTLENMRSLAEFYTAKFNEDIQKLHVRMPDGQYYASDYVKEDIELLKKLEEKGFTYKTTDGVYFDVSQMPDYGILTGGKTTHDESHARINENREKKNPEDFALWKCDKNIGFDSPYGKGFPGWHIECSALGIKFLGEQFDIHTGGIDHVPIHHTNEIAQSESATGKKPFVRYWLHHEHIDTSGQKMAKSSGNILTLDSVIEKNINPLSYRFWLLMGQYRTKMNFNWEALSAADVALKRLYRLFLNLGDDVGNIDLVYQAKFQERIEDDLDTPRALSLLWDLIKDETVSVADRKATILDFDQVLGLGFDNLKEESIPLEIQNLVSQRQTARANKDFQKSDELRDKISSLGYEVKDTEEGQKITKI
jgi:cysteinyl-tRNA synthetase